MKITSIVLAAAVLTGAAAAEARPPISRVCSASATVAWAPVRGRFYPTEAFANGQACGTAVVTIVVRARDGKVLWADARPAAEVMTFVEAKTPSKMTAALAEWLTQHHTFKSTADLPVWKKGAEAPDAGEFPFYPDAGLDRDAYEQLRAAKLPVFCYVQGMESMACLSLSADGQIDKIGLQLFPG
jgi:hypothetical protein